MTTGRIVISSENRLFREGLRRILQGSSITVVGEANSLQAAFDSLSSGERPNLILSDPSADTHAEFAVMRRITTEFTTVSVVIITNDLRSSVVDQAIESGARGFLPLDLSPAALEMLLKLVLMGENIFPGPHHLRAEVANAGPRSGGSSAEALSAPLSQKEREVLGCIGSGMSNKLIARNLNIAEATVKVHIKSVLRKTSLRNRTQAAIWLLGHRPNSSA